MERGLILLETQRLLVIQFHEAVFYQCNTFWSKLLQNNNKQKKKSIHKPTWTYMTKGKDMLVKNQSTALHNVLE